MFQASCAGKEKGEEVEKDDGGVLVDGRHLWGSLLHGDEVGGGIGNVNVGRLREDARADAIDSFDVAAKAIPQYVEVDTYG